MTLHIPRWEELPQIPLYMDQVVQYLNDTLDCLNFSGDKPLLTASMVNNYVKNSIIKKPERKQYKPYHLAFLIVVVLMKRTFSLKEISDLIEIYSDIEQKERVARDYNRFASVFEDCLQEVMETARSSREYFENPDLRQLLMVDVIRTLACKIYADYHLYCSSLQKDDLPSNKDGLPADRNERRLSRSELAAD